MLWSPTSTKPLRRFGFGSCTSGTRRPSTYRLGNCGQTALGSTPSKGVNGGSGRHFAHSCRCGLEPKPGTLGTSSGTPATPVPNYAGSCGFRSAVKGSGKCRFRPSARRSISS